MSESESRKSDLFLIAAACPLIAASDTVVNAIALGIATILIAVASTAIVGLLIRWLDDTIRLTATVLILATLTAIVELAMRAWFHVARESLSLFLPLIVTNLALAHSIMDARSGLPANLKRVAKLAAAIALILVTLGAAREIVGRGSLLYNAQALIGSLAGEITLFRVDMGFLLAMLPPGAFLAFGLLLAMRNWLAGRRALRT
jgi:electron transport complex protein RnfE